jgi:hypothetical protein
MMPSDPELPWRLVPPRGDWPGAIAAWRDDGVPESLIEKMVGIYGHGQDIHLTREGALKAWDVRGRSKEDEEKPDVRKAQGRVTDVLRKGLPPKVFQDASRAKLDVIEQDDKQIAAAMKRAGASRQQIREVESGEAIILGQMNTKNGKGYVVHVGDDDIAVSTGLHEMSHWLTRPDGPIFPATGSGATPEFSQHASDFYDAFEADLKKIPEDERSEPGLGGTEYQYTMSEIAADVLALTMAKRAGFKRANEDMVERVRKFPSAAKWMAKRLKSLK